MDKNVRHYTKAGQKKSALVGAISKNFTILGRIENGLFCIQGRWTDGRTARQTDESQWALQQLGLMTERQLLTLHLEAFSASTPTEKANIIII